MKKLKFFFILSVLSLAFVSCSKDDDDDAPSVSGNKYESTYVKMTMSGSMTASIEFSTKAELQENDWYEVIEFKANGDFYSGDENVGTWTQSGSKITVVSDDESGTATVSGNVITFKDSGTEDGVTYNMELRYTKI